MGGAVPAVDWLLSTAVLQPQRKTTTATTMEERSGSRLRPAAAITLAAVLVCALLAVVCVVEVDLEEDHAQSTVLESAWAAGKGKAKAKSGKSVDSSDMWLDRVKKSHDQRSFIRNVSREKIRTAKQQADDAIKARKLALEKAHENNNLRRKTIRKAATTSAKHMLAKAISAMSANVRTMAASAAAHAATSVVKHSNAGARAAQANKHSMSAQAKLKLLEKDVALLEAAEKRALQEAKDAKLKFEKKDARYKAIVNEKVLRAEKDFVLMKKKLAAYKGAKHREKITAEKLRRLAQEVVRLSARLRREKDHVIRLQRMHKKFVRRWKKNYARRKSKLKKMIRKFKKILKALKAQLNRIRSAKDINAVMASRITAEQSVVAQQEQKLAQENAYIKRLKRMLARARRNTQMFQRKAKKRKRVLRIAHVAYINLERAVNNLKRMARNHAKIVSIKVDHANAAKDTKVFVRNVERTVKSLQKKSRAAIARAVARRAAAAAAAEARAQDKLGDNIPGINRALKKTKGLMKNLGKPPATLHKSAVAKGPNALKAASRLLRRTRKAEQRARIKVTQIRMGHYRHHAAKAAAATMLQENAGAVSHAEATILARVAHKLFRKAQKSKSKADRVAAKVAMKRALASRP